MGDPQVTISITKLIVHDLHFFGLAPLKPSVWMSCPVVQLSFRAWWLDILPGKGSRFLMVRELRFVVKVYWDYGQLWFLVGDILRCFSGFWEKQYDMIELWYIYIYTYWYIILRIIDILYIYLIDIFIFIIFKHHQESMWFPPSQSDVLESIRNPEAVGVSMVPRDHWPKNLRGGFESEGWRFLEISGHDRISFIEVYWWWWWWWWFFFFEFLESFDWTSFGHWTTFMEKKRLPKSNVRKQFGFKRPYFW